MWSYLASGTMAEQLAAFAVSLRNAGLSQATTPDAGWPSSTCAFSTFPR